MTDQTARLGMPLISAGQAQKEITHNEALVIADMAIQPVVVDIAPAAIPASPVAGQCWIVGQGASGAWQGHDGNLACWTGAGWRFVVPFTGMTAWSLATGLIARRTASDWVQGAMTAATLSVSGNQVVAARQPAIASPTGGATIDSEARLALGSILSALRTHGLIAT